MSTYKTHAEYNFAIESLQGKLDQMRAQDLGDTGLAKEFETTIANFERERDELPGPRLTAEKNKVLGQDGPVISTNQRRPSLKAPNAAKDYKALFGSGGGYNWQGKDASDNFFQAVFSGRHDPRLIRSGLNETTPSDGGFWVPTETVQKIHNISLENELIMPRAFVQPMISNEIKIPGVEIGDHGTSLYGGFKAAYVGEGEEIPEENPKARDMTLMAKKLTGRLKLTNELVQDMVGGPEQIINICGQGLAWYRDRAFLKGSGAGQPLGILNAGCTIEIAKLSGQANDTIHYENLTMMLARLHAASFNRSVWICHQSTIPQLMQLFVVHEEGDDTLGSHYPVLREDGSGFKMLTRPVLFTEKSMPLGSRGDVILADLSQYIIGLRQGMRFDLSPHVYFTSDQLAARLIERHDGQPLWDGPLTLEDGSTTVSPFVVLGERKNG